MTLDTEPTPKSFRPVAARVGLRAAAYGLAAALVLAAIWVARTDGGNAAPVAAALPLTTGTAFAVVDTNSPTLMPALSLPGSGSQVSRLAELHTTIPTRADYNVKQYSVEAQDTLFSIAAKFSLKPATILWGNPELADNPNILSVGKTVNILPVDGALRTVMTGDTLDKIAKVFHVTGRRYRQVSWQRPRPTQPANSRGAADHHPRGLA